MKCSENKQSWLAAQLEESFIDLAAGSCFLGLRELKLHLPSEHQMLRLPLNLCWSLSSGVSAISWSQVWKSQKGGKISISFPLMGSVIKLKGSLWSVALQGSAPSFRAPKPFVCHFESDGNAWSFLPPESQALEVWSRTAVWKARGLTSRLPFSCVWSRVAIVSKAACTA